jgi:hypothetical protein
VRILEWIDFLFHLAQNFLRSQSDIILTCFFTKCYLIIRLESMADDQYREYGYSEKEREAPGYLRSMFNALSGAKDNGDMFLVSGEEEDSQEEAAGIENGDATDFNESRRPKQLPEKGVTDGKYVKDNSSESSGRISHPGPKSYNFDASGFENFPLPTDSRGMFTSTVRPRLGPEPLFSSRLALPREESSGGDDFAGGHLSVRKSIGSIHNVTKRV